MNRILEGFVWVLMSVCAFAAQAFANDIKITNLTVHPHSGGNGEVEFDLTWRNSWRSTTEPYNWDAAWVFCKLRRNGGEWTHLKLKTSGHTIPSTPQAITTAMGLVDTGAAYNSSTNPAVGIFLYRTNDGFGTFTANDMRLQWSYADNGASSGDVIEIRVVGVEMVYIPSAAFYVGDGDTDNRMQLKQGSADTDPWYISSESSISVTNATSDGYYNVSPGWTGSDDNGATFTISGAFPKGYSAFYMMKGELSQSQWVAFFNTLTTTQKNTRDITDSTGKNSDDLVARNNISWTSGDATLPDRGGGATYAGVALSFTSWNDIAAILDWSCLRPMTELEYEKAARGPKAAVPGEYAWGTTTITGATSITDAGLPTERGNTGSNVTYGNAAGVQGPVRVGSFTKGVDTRIASGGGFYGVMDLSGNVWERAVMIANSTERSFEGRYHGDGMLDTTGDANVSTWPLNLTNYASLRGGSFNEYGIYHLRVSHRGGRMPTIGTRSGAIGGRGVRSAPQ